MKKSLITRIRKDEKVEVQKTYLLLMTILKSWTHPDDAFCKRREKERRQTTWSSSAIVRVQATRRTSKLGSLEVFLYTTKVDG